MGLRERILGAPHSVLQSSSCALPRKAVIRPEGVSQQARTEVVILLSLFHHPYPAELRLCLPSLWASVEKTLFSPLYVQGK